MFMVRGLGYKKIVALGVLMHDTMFETVNMITVIAIMNIVNPSLVQRNAGD